MPFFLYSFDLIFCLPSCFLGLCLYLRRNTYEDAGVQSIFFNGYMQIHIDRKDPQDLRLFKSARMSNIGQYLEINVDSRRRNTQVRSTYGWPVAKVKYGAVLLSADFRPTAPARSPRLL